MKWFETAYLRYVYSRDSRFRFSRRWQEEVLNKFEKPRNLYERSYYQYLCQKKMNGVLWSLLNVVSPLLLVSLLVRSSLASRPQAEELGGVVCLTFGVSKKMVPSSLLSEFEKSRFVVSDTGRAFKFDDFFWLLSHWRRRPLEFFFIYKIAIKMLRYRFLFEKYSPDCIATHSEYSCTSSLLTEFCNNNGVKHYNFMHGEKPFYIRDSFFYFDKIFVFDLHYLSVFSLLRASWGEAKVEVPKEFILDESKFESIKKYDYCYYLAAEAESVLENIFESLQLLQKKGKKVKVRLHPRWTDYIVVLRLSEKFRIELESQCSIEESIASVSTVVSLFSTVMLQALLAGKNICVDDVSNSAFYEKILDLDLLFLNKNCTKLSEVLCPWCQ